MVGDLIIDIAILITIFLTIKTHTKQAEEFLWFGPEE